VAAFADEVDDGPVIFPSLNIAKIQGNDVGSTQATAEEKRIVAASRFSRIVFCSDSREGCFTLWDAEPVANAPAILRHALHTPDARDQFWAQQPGIGCLIRQPTYGS